ncbi:helix-turn-helix transcriptional regulator [Glycocaulis profundi]|nr:helix-turn-helix transcriptional regulator [Glycocaulis profundi]
MTLSDWLKTSNVTPSAFADRIGVSRQAVHRYVEGDRIPRREVLTKINEATGGAVTANDFLAPQPEARP